MNLWLLKSGNCSYAVLYEGGVQMMQKAAEAHGWRRQMNNYKVIDK